MRRKVIIVRKETGRKKSSIRDSIQKGTRYRINLANKEKRDETPEFCDVQARYYRTICILVISGDII